ncbi:glutathione S-transferase [Alsobacter sp. SYSU M60028]|uniref:Glutathione S-transferase n=1 Tax=Alsobacter ponti TaxID=2962936 RepID=A0ABT1LCR7_9HYPH|nr:glutathione S-transferase [Alsobacter ponti]MCP8938693.1 glutathione S-transferase [Alsobacter ponti]
MADERTALDIGDAVNETCPWSGKPISADSLTLYRGFVVGFCNPGCRDKFEAATRHFDAALAGYLPDDDEPDDAGLGSTAQAG